jgi:AraC-like DNA-binding protein
LDAYHSPREWRVIGHDYAVTFLHTWRGEVNYRGRQSSVERGIAFCNYPDEALIAAPEAGRVGSFNVLALSPALIHEWASELRVRGERPQWKSLFPRLSPELTMHFLRLSKSLRPGTAALQLQSDGAELAQLLVQELVAGVADVVPGEGPAIRGTSRMRECLHETGFDVDLDTLAREAGLSRFQALRAFKRRYGLPPHAYQLRLRISRARTMLRAGASPADVAAYFGFVDQSHMTRHFKRIVGVTPMQYVLSGAGPAPELTNAFELRVKRS